MSYFICTVERYKKQAVCGLERENERLDDYRDVSGHIDKARTKFNYHLVFPHGSYRDFVDDKIRLLDLKKPLRASAVHMCSLVITASSAFFDTMSSYEERDFFESCSNALCTRFGQENVVSAVVHKDETRPHMHFNFVPIKDGALSSNKVICGDLYADFLTQIYEAIGRPWGLVKGDLSSGIRKLSMQKYKHKTTLERAAELADKIVEESRIEKESFYETEERVTKLKIEESALKLSVDALTREKTVLEKDVEKMRVEKDCATKAESTRIPVLKRKKTAKTLLQENAALKERCEDLEKAKAEIAEEATCLREENKNLAKKLLSFERLADMAVTAIKTNPDKFKEILREAANSKDDQNKDDSKKDATK